MFVLFLSQPFDHIDIQLCTAHLHIGVKLMSLFFLDVRRFRKYQHATGVERRKFDAEGRNRSAGTVPSGE